MTTTTTGIDDSSRRARFLDSAIFYAREFEDHARELGNVVPALTRSERRAAHACARAAKKFRRVLRRRERDARRLAERITRQRLFGVATSCVGDMSVVGEVFATRVVPMLADDGRALANLCATSKACKRLVEMAGVLPHDDVRAFCSKHTAAGPDPRPRLFSRESVFALAVREKDFAEGNPNFETLRFACERWGLGPLPQAVFERYMNNAYGIHARLDEVEWLLANTSFDESKPRACELVVKRLAYFMTSRETSAKIVARVVQFLQSRVEPMTSEHKILTPGFREYLEGETHLAPILSWARQIEK
jgi:hypothetical protein